MCKKNELGKLVSMASADEATIGLSEACDRGEWAKVGGWLDKGARPDGVEFWRVTPLEACARNGRWAAVKLLLEAGANVNKASDQDFTPLMAAVVGGSPKMVKRLLAAGADPLALNETGKSTLHMIGSSTSGNSNALAALLARGGALARLESRENDDNSTPLMWSIAHVDAKAVVALVELGARVDDLEVEGQGAVAYIESVHGADTDEAIAMKAALGGALAQREKKALEQEAVMAIKPGPRTTSRRPGL